MTERQCSWAIIVHGGAKEIEPKKEEPNRAGSLEAVRAGQAILACGGSAVEAVEAAIRVLEDDPTFNAGYGSDLNSDGEVEMDAAIMDGSNFDVGGVAAIMGVPHPISVARKMLSEEPVLLAGAGARRFAAEHHAELCDPEALISLEQAERRAASDNNTVGCVALDSEGNIAAGTSTGGLPDAPPGRVGDSPMPGCGLYAENGIGGVSLSGTGEDIARMMLASRIMHGMKGQHPQSAVEAALDDLHRIEGEAGAIAIDLQGQIGWAHNSAHFAIAYVTSEMDEPAVWLKKDEETIEWQNPRGAQARSS